MPKYYCEGCLEGNRKKENNLIYICNSCSDFRIYYTYAIKDYKLTNEDLMTIQFGEKNIQKNLCRYYLLEDIIYLVESKYGENWKEHIEYLKNIKIFKKEQIKNERINLIKNELNLNWHNCLKDHCIQKFIDNGKNLNKILNCYKPYYYHENLLKETLKLFKLEYINVFCENYLNKFRNTYLLKFDIKEYDNNLNTIMDVVNATITYNFKKNILYEELNKHGYKFKRSSATEYSSIQQYSNVLTERHMTFCNKFLYSSYNLNNIFNEYNDVENIIRNIKETDYLYNKTNYKKILQRCRKKYIKNQKNNINNYIHDEINDEIVKNIARSRVIIPVFTGKIQI